MKLRSTIAERPNLSLVLTLFTELTLMTQVVKMVRKRATVHANIVTQRHFAHYVVAEKLHFVQLGIFSHPVHKVTAQIHVASVFQPVSLHYLRLLK